jgi:hypothetical protein
LRRRGETNDGACASVTWNSRGSSARSASARAGSRMPNTMRMITSSVIASVIGLSRIGSPAGQRRTSRSVSSRISGRHRASRSPCSGGSRSLRIRRWASSSSRNSDERPPVGSMIVYASPAWNTRGSPVKIRLISAGSAT